MGLIAQIFRAVKHQLARPFSRFKKKPEEGVEEVPTEWMEEKGKSARPGTEKWRPKGSRKVEKRGSRYVILKPTRKLYHWPWLRNLKRALAGILLIINLFIGEFILATTPGGLILFFLFGANSVILIDYLWKTMKRKEE
jgi:hypothetical protein